MKQNNLSLITLENAGIFRSGRWLVRGVTMSLEQGEILTLIGPNGSGKTTTAKMALGLLRPDEGTSHRHKNIKIRYVPQKVSIDWTVPLKVKRLMSLTGKVNTKDAEEALTLTGTLHLVNSDVKTLSGGEFQRVLLARALAFKPDLLVLDEPVQGVDYKGEIELYDLIRNIRNKLHCGVLLISHDLHIVMAATDRVICLNGHVCCCGTPSAVASSREYKALFGTHDSSGLALYNHHHNNSHFPEGIVNSKDRADDDSIHNEADITHDLNFSVEYKGADSHDG